MGKYNHWYQWVNGANISMNKIKEYLTKTNLSIKEIAFLTGMESDCSLCKIFKRETGVSPTAYRASVHNHK